MPAVGRIGFLFITPSQVVIGDNCFRLRGGNILKKLVA
jgi:hypothetical protein